MLPPFNLLNSTNVFAIFLSKWSLLRRNSYAFWLDHSNQSLCPALQHCKTCKPQSKSQSFSTFFNIITYNAKPWLIRKMLYVEMTKALAFLFCIALISLDVGHIYTLHSITCLWVTRVLNMVTEILDLLRLICTNSLKCHCAQQGRCLSCG